MKNLLNITDLTTTEIDELINTANDIYNNNEKYQERCKGKQLATLFFEPSTRTRLSFESAMLSLGGNVLGFSEAQNSSTAKGESLGDTIRTVSSYVDIIAMRHPKEGAPEVAIQNSFVPIINAGDGGHNHPTQTLTDLFTIKNEKGRLDNLTIGICGDLKYGRTVHSLIASMIRYDNIKFILISPKELELPDYITKNILEKNNVEYKVTDNLEEYMSELDILYMTRIQKERFSDIETYEKLKDVYILDNNKLKNAKPDLNILHPLPRVNEIAKEVDNDKRATYFKQVKYGKFIRMALILYLLDKKQLSFEENRNKAEISGKVICSNPRCISNVERNIEKEAILEDGEYRCKYCESNIEIINE